MSRTLPEARTWRAACLTSIVLLLALSVVAAAGPLPGDVAVRDLALAAAPALHGAAAQVNHGGTWRVLLPATVVLMAAAPLVRRRWWLWCAALVVAPAVEGAWKTIVGRPRPQGGSLGFPSGHVTAMATFGVILLYVATRVRAGTAARAALVAVAVLAPAAVGAARLVLDAHWLSDVMGGVLLGASGATAAAWWDATHPARGHADPGPRRSASATPGPAAG